MTSPAVTVAASASIKAAARLLRDRNVAAAPVVDEAGALVGIVSEIDLLRGTLAPDPVAHLLPVPVDGDALPELVADVMTREVLVLLPHDDLHDAARAMRASGVRSLPVVDGSTVVGVVSRADLLRVLAREDDEIVRELRTVLAAELGPHVVVDVDVVGGVVALRCRAADLPAAVLVASRVPGVVHVRTTESPES
jgi:CBS domain-containing protein